MNIQSEMSERAIELLQLAEDQVQVNKILQLVSCLSDTRERIKLSLLNSKHPLSDRCECLMSVNITHD